MRKTIRFWVAALVLVMTAAAGAQDKPAPSVSTAPAKLVQIPLKIQLVLSRYQGEKKLSSIPYLLWVTASERLGSASLRMGVKIPIMTGGGAYNYQDVGTNIDCNAAPASDNNFKVTFVVSDSSVYFPDRPRSDAGNPIPSNVTTPPAIRSFTSNFSILLRDGQTAQYTTATDQVSGEVLKIDATLNVLK